VCTCDLGFPPGFNLGPDGRGVMFGGEGGRSWPWTCGPGVSVGRTELEKLSTLAWIQGAGYN
jgi:hypothetical protein